MTMRSVEEVLTFFRSDDPREIEITDLHIGMVSADPAVASESAARVAERQQRGEYLVRVDGKGEAAVVRSTAMELRRRGARFTGQRQPDPLPPA